MPEGDSAGQKLNIAGFCERLRELARRRVHSGAISERALARRASISQPHLHNVLKGIRLLSPDAADRLMEALGVTLPELLWMDGSGDMGKVCAVPVLKSRIGPGVVAMFDSFRGYLPFPSAQLAGLVEPVAAVLAPDLALPSACQAGDVVLLDQNRQLRIGLSAVSCWVVAENSGLRVRYLRRAGGGLEAGSDPDLSGSASLQRIPLRGNILEIVRARIVWIGREMETTLAGPHGPSREGH